MSIELNSYGICLDSDWCYIALDWKLLIVSWSLLLAYKFYKRKKNK